MIADIQETAVTSSIPQSGIRVLFIVDSIWGAGGAEMCLLRMVRDLQLRGCECRVLTFNTNDSANAFRDQFPCEMIHWKIERLYDLQALKVGLRIRRLVKDLQIDIVHTFFHASDLWAGPIAKFSGAKALISSRRDTGFRRTPLNRLAYRLLRNVYDEVHAVSEEVRRCTLAEDGVSPERIITVRNGVEDAAEPCQIEMDKLRGLIGAPGAPIVTCVANLRHVKGIDILVRAAVDVLRRVPNIRFVVAGALGARENLKYSHDTIALARALGVDHSFVFLDQISAVTELLHQSDVFVLPSRTEGLSNALLEAMRAALPCVATAVGGNPEVVVDGVTGFIVAPENPAALAERISELLLDPALRKAMGAEGRERILREFSATTMTDRVLASYHSLLEKNLARRV